MKTIKYYRKNQFGQEREFVHPENEGDAAIIRQLVGQKTIDGRIRQLIRELTAGQVTFEQTISP